MASFEKAYQRTAINEGGFNADDEGFPSAFGIRKKDNPNWDGWKTIDPMIAAGKSEREINRFITHDTTLANSAKTYYKKNYWDSLKLDFVNDDSSAYELFDHGVNAGIGTSTKVARKALGLKSGVEMDDSLLSTLNKLGKNATPLIGAGRKSDYESKKNKEGNISGWLKRIQSQDTGYEEIAYKKGIEQSTQAGYKQEVSLRDASFLDKTVAFGLNASVNSTTNDIVKFFKMDDAGLDRDSKWIESMRDPAVASNVLQTYGLDAKHYNDIAKSTSKEHLRNIIASIHENEWQNQFISMKLGTFGTVASALTGGLIMSPENLLLPVMIPMRASVAIRSAKEAYELGTAARGSLFAARALRPAESISPASGTMFSESMFAAQQVAFANKASGIKNMAMLQGASLAAVVPSLKYAINKDYTQTEAFMDLMLYGVVDMGFIAHSAKTATSSVINDTNAIVSRIKSFQESMSKSSNEFARVTELHRSELVVTQSVERMKEARAKLKRTIDAETERLKMERISGEVQSDYIVAQSVKTLKTKKAKLDKALHDEEQRLRDLRLEAETHTDAVISESVEKLAKARAKLNSTIEAGTRELVSTREAIERSVNESAANIKAKQKASAAKVKTLTMRIQGIRTHIENLRTFRDMKAEDAKDVVRAYTANPSHENFLKIQDAQAVVAKIENDITTLTHTADSGDAVRISETLKSINSNLDTLVANGDIRTGLKDDIAEVVDSLKNNPVPRMSEDEALKVIDEAGLSKLVNDDGTITAKIKVEKDGSFHVTDKDGFRMSIGSKVGLAVVALSGSAFASDGKSVDALDITSLGVLALFVAGLYVFKGKRSGTQGIDTAKLIMSEVKSKLTTRVDGGTAVSSFIENSFESLAGWWSESGKPLFESTTKTTKDGVAVSDIARVLIRDQRNLGSQTVASVEDLSAGFIASNKYDFVVAETEALDEAYKIAKANLTPAQRASNFFFENEFMSSVRRSVTHLIENPNLPRDAATSKIATAFNNSMSKMLRIAQTAGVEGAQGLSNFVPRYWKSSDTYDILMHNPEAIAKVEENLYKMFLSAGSPSAKARELAKYRIEKLTGRMRGTRVEKAEIEHDDISNRFKDREPMDKNAWEPFDVVVNGRTIKMDVSHVIEDDIAVIYDKYVHEMAGQVALAQHGYKSYSRFYELLDDIPNDVERVTLTELADISMGKEIVDHTSRAYKIAQSGKNIATAVLLPLGGVNMVAEMYRLAFKTSGKASGFMYGYRKFAGAVMDTGRDSSFMDMMTNFHGAGMDARIGSLTHRGFAETNIVSSSVNENMLDDILNISSRARDATMTFSQLPKLTDFARSISLELNMDLLARHLNGKQSIHALDLQSWGITENTRKLLTSKLQLNSNGYLKKFNVEDMTPNEQLEFKRVIRNMGMTDIQMHTLGGTAQYTRNSTLGIGVSGLMGFAMQSYVTHGLRDIKGISRMRPESFLSSSLWLAGGMTTYYLKALLQGKDYSEEDAFAYAGTMMPIASPLSLKSQITEPASFSAIDRVFSAPTESVNIAKALLDE